MHGGRAWWSSSGRLDLADRCGVVLRGWTEGQCGPRTTGGKGIPGRSGSPELSSGGNLGTCKAETEGSGRGAGPGHGAELLQRLAVAGMWWCGESAAAQSSALSSEGGGG